MRGIEMAPFQIRVVEEKQELDEKIARLDAFVDGSLFSQASPDEQGRLHRQLGVMQMYSRILGERIAHFE